MVYEKSDGTRIPFDPNDSIEDEERFIDPEDEEDYDIDGFDW